MMKSLSLMFLHLKASGMVFYVNFYYMFFADVRFDVFFYHGTIVPTRTDGR
jgi:hypothetical protein